MLTSERDRYVQLNSFSRRPTLPQISSYLVVLVVNVSFWCLVQGNFITQAERFVMIALFSISLVVLLMLGLITSLLDPSDPVYRQHVNGNSGVVKAHIQQCLYCDYCRSYVLATSRHCKQCDRCVHKFDHHCIWINNCIGDINYLPFIGMIYSALTHLLLYLIALLLLWIENAWQYYLPSMILAWITALLSLGFSILLIALIALHMFLIYHHMTTFDYILSKKTAVQRQKFTNPILPNLEQRPQSNPVVEESGSNEHEATENYLGASAFDEFKHRSHRSPPKSEQQSSEHIKATRSKETLPPMQPFQTIEDLNELQEEHLKDVYRRNRSLKVLVGNSVKIKARRGSLSDVSSELLPKPIPSQNKVAENKDQTMVYYSKQDQEEREEEEPKLPAVPSS